MFGAFGMVRFTQASSVTTGGPGRVAVGVEADGEALVATWVSADALDWTRDEVDDPREPERATDLGLRAIVDTEDGPSLSAAARAGPMLAFR